MAEVHITEPKVAWTSALADRWPDWRQRAGSMALALLLELGLILLLLSLGTSIAGRREATDTLTTVDLAPDTPPAPKPAPTPAPDDARPSAFPLAPAPKPKSAPPVSQPVPTPVEVASPVPALPLPNRPSDPAPAKARAVIRDDMGGPIGPANTPRSGDSERIAGSGPNGEPLYRARWYREPTDQELRGYLSTAGGPGWALINCRTVAEFRVEDCVLVDQYPDNGGMGRAVLAAAWQFRVRPPQVGGQLMVGAWVRIRITLEMNKG